MYKIDRRGGGSKNRILGQTPVNIWFDLIWTCNPIPLFPPVTTITLPTISLFKHITINPSTIITSQIILIFYKDLFWSKYKTLLFKCILICGTKPYISRFRKINWIFVEMRNLWIFSLLFGIWSAFGKNFIFYLYWALAYLYKSSYLLVRKIYSLRLLGIYIYIWNISKFYEYLISRIIWTPVNNWIYT